MSRQVQEGGRGTARLPPSGPSVQSAATWSCPEMGHYGKMRCGAALHVASVASGEKNSQLTPAEKPSGAGE